MQNGGALSEGLSEGIRTRTDNSIVFKTLDLEIEETKGTCGLLGFSK
jgi:hypothetical protein